MGHSVGGGNLYPGRQAHVEPMVLEAFVIGFVAGLVASIPVGAAGITLMEVALTHGFLFGAASGCGIALVDATFALIAVAVGQPATEYLEPHRAVINLGGGLVIAAIGALASRRATLQAAAPANATVPGAPAGGLVRVVATLALLTAVNPLNIAYFMAIVVAAGRETFSGIVPCAAFVAGVTLACLVWMTLVAAIASRGARNAGEAFKRRVARWGHAIVFSIGLAMATYGGWLLWCASR